jgi:DNA polymerase (family 10)
LYNSDVPALVPQALGPESRAPILQGILRMSTLPDLRQERFRVAAMLREIAALLAIEGSDLFRVKAYQRGAVALEGLPLEFSGGPDAASLQSIPGIGPSLAAVIEEILLTGDSRLLSGLRGRLPPGILELASVLGVRQVRRLQTELGIRNLDELEEACRTGRVQTVKGFGAKKERALLTRIEARRERGRKALLHDALAQGERLLGFVRSLPAIEQADLGGELRRRNETSERLVLVAASSRPAAALQGLSELPWATSSHQTGLDSLQLEVASGLPVEAVVVAPPRYGPALLHATGSGAHWQRLVDRALERGLLLREDGLLADGCESEATTEVAVYRALGLPVIPPELREDAGEIEEAEAGETFESLVTMADVRGAVHCHTVYSDGRHTVEQMARAAEARGLDYLTITDHSPTAVYARGLSEDRLLRQWEEIERVQLLVKCRLLRGTESDILADGSLDYPPAILDKLDVVIASVHERHRLDADAMTERVVRALRQPWFKIWGHALGRYVLRRKPFACHMETILDAAAESRVAIEVNGDPHRLDMEPRWIREARRRGLRFVLSTDAHSTGDLDYLRYAVDTARRGGVRRTEVLNALDAKAFLEAVRP